METISLHSPNVTVKTMDDLGSYVRQARQELVILDNQLLVLRLNLGKLRVALQEAFAPVAGVVLPVLNTAVRRVTDFCRDAGAVMSALFGTVYKKAVTTTKKTGAAIRRSLASFDQLNRLQGGTGSGGTETQTTLEPINAQLTPELEAVVARIQNIRDRLRDLGEQIRIHLAPLGAIDLTGGIQAFGRLGESIAAFGKLVGESLSWAWFHLLTPLAQWTLEEAIPASVDTFRGALELLTAALSPLMAGIQILVPALEPAAQFLRDSFTGILTNVRARFDALAQGISQRSPQLETIFRNLGQCIQNLWLRAQPHLENLRSFFTAVFQGIADAAGTWLGNLTDIFEALTEFLAGALTGDWTRIWEGLKGILKGAVNGVIGLLNSLLSGMAGALNRLTGLLNQWHVEIPQWVPSIGGKTFGFNLKPVTAPQIPALAKGAVIPANQPFLALLGDQPHGTNIEAPLTTIQEAVTLALEDFLDGNMAGHRATVEVLGQLLEAVRSIHLGDDDLAAAVRRSQARRAVMKGGGYAL